MLRHKLRVCQFIGCDVGGVSESLVHGKTGMLVPPKDINAIAEAIEKYASNRELRFLHGQAGAAFVRKNFSIEKMLDELEDLYAVINQGS